MNTKLDVGRKCWSENHRKLMMLLERTILLRSFNVIFVFPSIKGETLSYLLLLTKSFLMERKVRLWTKWMKLNYSTFYLKLSESLGAWSFLVSSFCSISCFVSCLRVENTKLFCWKVQTNLEVHCIKSFFELSNEKFFCYFYLIH